MHLIRAAIHVSNKTMHKPILNVQDLTVHFDTDAGPVRAVDRVNFVVRPGEVLGVVGESGCGKSVTASAILRLIPSPPGHIDSGSIHFEGADLLRLPIAEMRRIRGRKISMIFQEPMTALSPLHRIGRQMVEALQLHRELSTSAARQLSETWLDRVGLPDPAHQMRSYPFELSGGMRQRVMIAMAMMLEPSLLIADEPTTALDVTVQAQILELMLAMKQRSTSMLLITHDMGVIWETCNRVLVMYASRVVEEGPVESIFNNPLHPYTQGLLRSIPALNRDSNQRLPSIAGQVPSLLNLPKGCHFNDRCPHASKRCFQEQPLLREFADDRHSACFFAEQWLRPKPTEINPKKTAP